MTVTTSPTMEFRGRGRGWITLLGILLFFFYLLYLANSEPTAKEILVVLGFPLFYWFYWWICYDVLPKRVVLTERGLEYWLWNRKRFEARWEEITTVRCVTLDSETLEDHSLSTNFVSLYRLVIRAVIDRGARKLVLTDVNHFSKRDLIRLTAALVWAKEHYGLNMRIVDRIRVDGGGGWLGESKPVRILDLERSRILEQAERSPYSGSEPSQAEAGQLVRWPLPPPSPPEATSFKARKWGFTFDFTIVWAILVLSGLVYFEISLIAVSPLFLLFIFLPVVLMFLFPPTRELVIGPEGIHYSLAGNYRATWKEITGLRSHFGIVGYGKTIRVNPCVSIICSNHGRPLRLFTKWDSFNRRELRMIFYTLVKAARAHNPDVLVQDELEWLKGHEYLFLGSWEDKA
jgi:hypothetical protein